MRLSERLRMVASMVHRCDTVADIGCDHAYLSVWLLREGIAGKALACDVRPGPLAKAEKTIAFFHMQERARTILCDGLAGVRPGEAQVIVMAGMGGLLMTRLLADGAAVVAGAERLVLQPQSDPELVRRQVYAAGFRIEEEQCTFEDGKYYVAFAAVKDNAPEKREKPYEPWEYRYGRCLTAAKNEIYLAWLTAECEKKTAMVRNLLAADTPLAAERLPGAAEELAELAGVIRRMVD